MIKTALFHFMRVIFLLAGVFVLVPLFAGENLSVEKFSNLFGYLQTYPLLLFAYVLAYVFEKSEFLKHETAGENWFWSARPGILGLLVSYSLVGAIVFVLA